MSLTDALNSDMDLASLAALARRGLAWWLEELAAMLPAPWRARLSSQPRIFAESLGEGRWRMWRDGRKLADGLSPAEAGRPLGILLDPAVALIREVDTPPMPASDVRRMLALDIDRLSPLSPALIHFDFEIVDPGAPGTSQKVLLGVVAKTAADDALGAARAAGLEPGRLSANAEAEGFSPRFDFLPAVLAARGEKRRRPRAWWWTAVAVLTLANLAVFVGRDMIDLSRLRRQVEAQEPMAGAAQQVKSHVLAEDVRRRALIAEGGRGEPLAMLEALTRGLPAGAWVQRLEWNRQSLRLVGFKPPAADITAAVRGMGEFANPRAIATDAAPDAAGGQPFDITADAGKAP
ncbi:MAG TPA: PilN domain-containing protein [Caulobacteraceae bacterium]|jgi:general secretion pathway protein L|nr:PilN domain-containing protein [Caulobacteraceae bacterium]